MSKAYLSLGSNVGDRMAHLQAAVQRLSTPTTTVRSISSVYETEHVGDSATSLPPYLNCVVSVETTLDPLDLLEHALRVETMGGRERPHTHSPRTIDIDLLAYDQITMQSARLTLPHPRLWERAFVLVPLSEIAPCFALPDGRRVALRASEAEICAQRIALWLGELALPNGSASSAVVTSA